MRKSSSGYLSSIMLAAALILMLSGCFSIFKKDNNSKTIVDLVDHMKASGINIEAFHPALFEMIVAEDGIVVKIDGADIQVFKYDTKIQKQKDKLDKIYQKGLITILGVDFSAKINGSFILLNYKDHPDEVKIVQAFESF
ncbi:MAG TPA: hypothetical protein DCZ94_18100 [Lentisphaeria bacterium]|nr:MAG: hypothetical protein A2X48_00705 [Lentisphaerae bacterium GWF2_49_21]HBC88859.1 hypothetical protein [Lentisphaeria bacterium]